MLRIRLDVNKHPLATIGVLDTGDVRLAGPENDTMENRYRVFDLFHSPPLDDDAVELEHLTELGEVWHDHDAPGLVAAVMELVEDDNLVFDP